MEIYGSESASLGQLYYKPRPISTLLYIETVIMTIIIIRVRHVRTVQVVRRVDGREYVSAVLLQWRQRWRPRASCAPRAFDKNVRRSYIPRQIAIATTAQAFPHLPLNGTTTWASSSARVVYVSLMRLHGDTRVETNNICGNNLIRYNPIAHSGRCYFRT